MGSLRPMGPRGVPAGAQQCPCVWWIAMTLGEGTKKWEARAPCSGRSMFDCGQQLWQAAWPEKGLRLWGCVPRPLPRSLQGPGWLPCSSDVQKELISCATCPELL